MSAPTESHLCLDHHHIPRLTLQFDVFSVTGISNGHGAFNDRQHTLRKLQTLDSVTSFEDPDVQSLPPSDEVLTLRISLRRTRLVLLVAVVAIIVITTTLALFNCAELERFQRKDMSIKQQEHLLDRYNSYSGNVASAVGRVLEVFVALTAQVLVLWLMTDSVLAVGSKWRVKIALLALGAGVGFLLTTSLNALNVQVRELPPTIRMIASDLSWQQITQTNCFPNENQEIHRRIRFYGI